MQIRGIYEIADKYDAFIIDIFGVLHDGIMPFDGTIECLKQLQSANKNICLLSNSPRRCSGAQELMDRINITSDLYQNMVTSGEATYEHLQIAKNKYGKKCWFIGPDHFQEVTEGVDLKMVDGATHADFIINSIPGTDKRSISELKEELEIAANKNIHMICANPDLVVNIGNEQHECAGTFAQYYEDVLGGGVTYFGKPHLPVYEKCHEYLGNIDKTKICAIGDALHTDIAGANSFGIDSIWCLSGIHREEFISTTPAEANAATYWMKDFRWG